jgi:zinc transporter, ZIP family
VKPDFPNDLFLSLALQNIPEGLAVSIPLKKSGMTKMRSLCLGQLSGAVEVLGAIVGAGFVLLVTSVLPYALSFAAGCMIFVTVTELLPQSQMNDSKWGTIGVMTGFVLMMTLDTGFG